jgi:hypothetical protein
MLAFNAAPADFQNDPNPFAEPWINKEDPFHYTVFKEQWVANHPRRHIIGLVGGNEVSPIKGSQLDIESDLKGITRPLTFCAEQEHVPVPTNATSMHIKNRKTDLRINVTPVHLPEYQMWGYASVPKPLPMNKETCGKPYKY